MVCYGHIRKTKKILPSKFSHKANIINQIILKGFGNCGQIAMQPGMQNNMQQNAASGMQAGMNQMQGGNMNQMQGGAMPQMQSGNMGQMQASNINQMQGGNMGQMPQGPSTINQAFTPEMLQQFKAQIVAYKLLSRNQPLPENIAASAIGKRGNQANFPSAIQGPGTSLPQQQNLKRETPKPAKSANAVTPGISLLLCHWAFLNTFLRSIVSMIYALNDRLFVKTMENGSKHLYLIYEVCQASNVLNLLFGSSFLDSD